MTNAVFRIINLDEAWKLRCGATIKVTETSWQSDSGVVVATGLIVEDAKPAELLDALVSGAA